MDRIFVNACVITMDHDRPRAQAFAVRNGRIAAIGPTEVVTAGKKDSTQVCDLRGMCVVPGMIDSHLHLVAYGLSLRSVDLRGVKSIDNIKGAVRERVKSMKMGELVRGGGWDQDKLDERRYPTKTDLDEVSPDNPVILSRVCGHVICLNSRALERIKIDANTADPPGGEIVREQNTQEPNGLLKETAADLAWKAFPEQSEEQNMTAAELACKEFVRVGLTTVHFMSATLPEARALVRLRDGGRLPIRVRLYVAEEDLEEIRAELKEDEMLRVCGVKVFMDGSLGGRTALLSEPYSDDPSTRGMETIDEHKAERTFERVHLQGLQLAVHSIGDEATKRALDLLQKTLDAHPIGDHRHRIEHASVLTAGLMDRIKALGLIVSVQPHFVTSDSWAVRRVGEERAKGVYAFRSLIERGIPTAAGSDCPVEPPSPLLGMRAAVTRGEDEGIELSAITPDERLSPEVALELYTQGAAFASREEGLVGILREGSYADFVVLSGDPITCNPLELDKIEVKMTIVGGRAVFEDL
jgi:predicted amidohydrolase YtcJ